MTLMMWPSTPVKRLWGLQRRGMRRRTAPATIIDMDVTSKFCNYSTSGTMNVASFMSMCPAKSFEGVNLETFPLSFATIAFFTDIVDFCRLRWSCYHCTSAWWLLDKEFKASISTNRTSTSWPFREGLHSSGKRWTKSEWVDPTISSS